MKREAVELWSQALGAASTVIRYGHWGRAVLAFPPEQGRARDFEEHGVVMGMAHLIEAGQLKLYCVDGYDRARPPGRYESWMIDDIVPWIHEDCGSEVEIATLGVSLGACQAAGFALKRADLFPLAMCFSGLYDPMWWPTASAGPSGSEPPVATPLDYIGNLDGDRLSWLRGRVGLLLVCGQGSQEEATGALRSTRRFADALAGREIRHELDLWGPRVQHDWPAWRAQIAHHMPRFC